MMGRKKVIDQTKDDQRYYVDLLTNGHNLLYLVANNKDASGLPSKIKP